MSKSQVVSIGAGILLCLFISFFVSCSGGGGGGGEGRGETSDPVDQNHNLAVQATVTFPASSPIDNSSASVMYDGFFWPLDTTNQADLEIFTNKVMDATILLPSRDGVEPPTVYLITTVVPGESEVTIDVEETAISLVLTGVDHRYLADPTTASWVKSVVKRHSADFIDDLAQKIDQDPYLLRPGNMANALGSLYSQAVAASDAALKVIYDPDNNISTPQMLNAREASEDSVYSPLSAMPAGADDFGDFYIKYDRTTPVPVFVFVPPDLLANENLTFMNNSMLPVLTRITDTTTDEVIKAIPETFMARAFSPAVLSPTNGPFGLPLPTWEAIDNGTRNIQVEVFSPGLSDFIDSSYLAPDSPCGPLLARASFSGAIMPLIGVVLPPLPSKIKNGATEVIFSVLQRADIFEKILYHWPRGEFAEGLGAVYNGMTSNVLSQIVESLAEQGFLDSSLTPELAALLGVKIATAEIAVASAGISVAALAKGLLETPSKVTYQLVYPAGLRDLAPRMMQKLAEGADNRQEFTLTGHGLAGVRFGGEYHTARLLLEAFNKEDEMLKEAWLDENFGYDLQTDAILNTITFKLPDAWTGIDTAIKYIRLTLHHCYIAPGWLGGFTDWTNYLEPVELPFYASSIEKFTIHLTQDLKITSVNETLLEKGDIITITGEGFAGRDSGIENEVFFMDKDNQPVSATISTSSETTISAYVPGALQLNDSPEMVTQHVGSSSVYVELSDGSQSNAVWVAVVPDPVTFNPEPLTSEMTCKDTRVSLFQMNDFPIYYTINDSGERPYNGPVTISETSEIKAYAKVLVNGVYYRSGETTKKYVTCQKGETFIPYPHGAECVVLQNQDLMPRRYCPLDEGEYNGPIETPFGYATCSYSWLAGGTDELAKEKHLDKGQTTVFSTTQFWAQPEGRPSYVYRPTASYHFCPDGSFGTACGD